MKKVIAISLSLLGVALLAGCNRQAINQTQSPTPLVESTNESADWQTYKNDTYRFRLEMPSNWFYKVYNLNSQTDFQFYDGQDSMVVFDSSELPTKPEIGHHFMITIYPSSNDFQNSWISDFEKKQAKNSNGVYLS